MRILAVWLVALAARGLYLWQISAAPFFDLRIGDAAVYHAWAQRIAAGDWIGSGVFYQAPLYPYFLAIVYRMFGEGVVAVRVIQALLGASACALVAVAATMLFGRRGWIAGLLLAVFPSAIFLDGLLDKSALVTFLMSALVCLLVFLAELKVCATKAVAARILPLFGAGALLGLLSLARENALLLFVPIAIWIAIARRAWTPVLLVASGGALVLLPVALRNYSVGGELHITTSQGGPNFYIGNHAGASGSYEALVIGHGNALDERDDATRLAEEASGRRLSARDVSGYWMGRAIADIRSQPLGWLRLLARKTALTFNAAPIADTESLDVYAEWSGFLRILRPFNFGVLLGIAVLGMVAAASRRVWLLYAIGATYATSVILFYVVERYRFPLAIVLTVFAAAAFTEWDSPRLRRLRVAAVGLAVVTVAAAHVPLENARASRATHYFNVAAVLAADPARGAEASDFYRRALEVVPEFPPAHYGIATLLERDGRTDEATGHYQQALETWPQYREARSAIVKALVRSGVALDRAGRTRDAIAQYQRALTIDPNDAQAHNNLGVSLGQEGRIDEALEHFQKALTLNPSDESARRNVALVLQMRKGKR